MVSKINTGRITKFVSLTRPQNAAAVALGYSVGYFLNNVRLSLGFVLGFIILMLLHSAATLQNDVEDFDIDKANHRKSYLQSKRNNGQQVIKAGWVLSSAALVVAVVASQRLWNVICVGIFVILSWLYNKPPARLSRRPVSSIITMGLCYGSLPLIYGYIIGGSRHSVYALSFIVFWFIQRFSTSILKDFKDAKGDKQFGKRTFYLTYGLHKTTIISIAFSLLAYAGVIATLLINNEFSGLSLAILCVTTLLAIRNVITRLGLVKTSDEKRLSNIFSKVFVYQNQFDAAVLLCLLTS